MNSVDFIQKDCSVAELKLIDKETRLVPFSTTRMKATTFAQR